MSQLQAKLSAKRPVGGAKVTDGGHGAVAAKAAADPPYTSASPDKKRFTARTFQAWLGLDGPAQESADETQRKIYEAEDNFLGLGRLRGSRKP